MRGFGGTKRWFAALVAAASLAAVAGPATAACFESGVGCTDDHRISTSVLRGLSCDALWTVRNSIYNDNGYCFKTSAARSVFDNSDCYVNNAANLHFNSYESTNISRIVSVEKQFGCR